MVKKGDPENKHHDGACKQTKPISVSASSTCYKVPGFKIPTDNDNLVTVYEIDSSSSKQYGDIITGTGTTSCCEMESPLKPVQEPVPVCADDGAHSFPNLPTEQLFVLFPSAGSKYNRFIDEHPGSTSEWLHDNLFPEAVFDSCASTFETSNTGISTGDVNLNNANFIQSTSKDLTPSTDVNKSINKTESVLTTEVTSDLFGDDSLANLSKLNSKLSTQNLLPELDKIGTLDLDNIDETLDLCKNSLNDNILHSQNSESASDGTSSSVIEVALSSDQTIPLSDCINVTENLQCNSSAVSGSQENSYKSSDCQSDTPLFLNISSESVAALQRSDFQPTHIFQLIHDNEGQLKGYVAQPISSIFIQTRDVGENHENTTKQKSKTANHGENDGRSTTRYTCQVAGCGKIYQKKAKFRLHSMTHCGVRPFKCTLPDCEWAFTSAYKLKRHMDSHEGRKDFICQFMNCGRKFTTVHNLRYHQHRHKNPLRVSCTQKGCHLKFMTKHVLHRHLMTAHKDTGKTYKCPFEGCNKMFISKHCIGSHARCHQYTKDDLTCKVDGCGRIFEKMRDLRLHAVTHSNEKPYPCKVEGCTWSFMTPSRLTRHTLSHTQERRYYCTVQDCNKTFLRSEHLKSHVQSHRAKILCSYQGCKAKLRSAESLNKHLRKHDQSAIFHCPLESCSQFFSSKAAVRLHLMRQHKSDSISELPVCQTPTVGEDRMTDVVRGRNISITSLPNIPVFSGTENDAVSNRKSSVRLDVPATLDQPDVGLSANLLSSHGITFRDPETGTIYLQTQLLQDDPPNRELFTSTTAADLDLELRPATTINLHDLQ